MKDLLSFIKLYNINVKKTTLNCQNILTAKYKNVDPKCSLDQERFFKKIFLNILLKPFIMALHENNLNDFFVFSIQ